MATDDGAGTPVPGILRCRRNDAPHREFNARWHGPAVASRSEAGATVWVLDDLSTHQLASSHEGFPPGQARRVAERLEIRRPLKHGSRLNRAEIELSMPSRRCLNRRIESMEEIKRQRPAWAEVT